MNTTPSPSPEGPATDEPANPSKADLVKMMKNVRNLGKQVEALIGDQERFISDLSDRVLAQVTGLVEAHHTELKRRVEVNELVTDLIPDGSKRDLARRLLTAENPADPRGFLSELVKDLSPSPRPRPQGQSQSLYDASQAIQSELNRIHTNKVKQ